MVDREHQGTDEIYEQPWSERFPPGVPCGGEPTKVTDTSSLPWSAFCTITARGSRVGYGTGFLCNSVSSPKYWLICTAAHVLWDETENALVSSVTIVPKRLGTHEPDGSIDLNQSYLHVCGSWKTNQSRDNDYGGILVDAKQYPELQGGLGLDIAGDELKDATVCVAGYRKAIRGKGRWIYYDEGPLVGYDPGSETISYNLTTVPGQSGGPVLMKTSSGGTNVVGIHVGATPVKGCPNQALRISYPMYMEMVGWSQKGPSINPTTGS